MEKNFDKWNELKKEIDIGENNLYPKVWEIWYINIWINIWNESLWKWKDFKRAFLIIKKIWNMFFWASMTTQWKDGNYFYIRISDRYFNKKSYIIKSQLKSIDKKRFIEKMWILTNKDFYNIKKELIESTF